MRTRLWLLAAGLAAAFPALAQNVISARSGLVHYVEGKAALAGKPLESKFGQFPDLKEGQTLATETGRAEMLLTPGVFLRMDENSSVRMITNRLVDTRLELERGTAMVEALEMGKDNHVALVAKGATVNLRKNGLYRIDAGSGVVRVYEGEAVVEQGNDRLTLHGSREATLGAVLAAQKFNNKLGDSFYRWGRRRSEYIALANVSGSRTLRDRGGWLRSGWSWNPYYGMFTFVPYRGVLYSPYGYAYWSPREIMRVYEPRRAPDSGMTAASSGGGPGYNSALGYNTATRSSGAYSSPAPAVSSGGQAPAAAASPRAGDSASPRAGGSGGRGR